MSQKKSGHVADNADKQNKEDSLIPNGELKWRKEEEEDLQDTEINLKQSKEDKTKQKEKEETKKEETTKEKITRQEKESESKKSEEKATKKEQTTTKSKDSSQNKAKKTEKKPEANQKQKDKPNSEQESAAATEAKKEYSIEDTLGPIDFKEYPVELESEEKKKKETKSPDQSTFVFKKEKKEKAKKRKPITREKVKTPQIQLPKWKFTLRVLWLPISLVFALFIGLIVGNTVIGEQPVSEAFNIDNWIHLYKLIFTK